MEQISREVAEKIAQQSFVFDFHTSSPTFRKRVNSGFLMKTINPDYSQIEPDRLVVSKALIKSQSLKDISKHVTSFVAWVKFISLPGGMLTPGYGQWLVPTTLLPELRNRLNEFERVRAELVQKFLEDMPSLIEQARIDLGPLFDESQYLNPEEIRDSFKVKYKFVSNLIPEEFEKISKTIYEQEKARVIQECSSAAIIIQETLREKFADLVSHLHSRLGNDSEGKPLRFQKGSVEHLKDFVAIFRDLNLTGDVELENLVNKTQLLLQGTDVKKIRSDEEFRTSLNDSFGELTEKLSTMIVPKTRRLNLDGAE